MVCLTQEQDHENGTWIEATAVSRIAGNGHAYV